MANLQEIPQQVNPPGIAPQQLLIHVPPTFSNLPTFDPNEITFTAWTQIFTEFCILNNIGAEPPGDAANPHPHNRRRALFLTHVGSRAYEILRQTCLPLEPNRKTIPELVRILRDKYEPIGLKHAHRLTLGKRRQNENESIHDYIAVLQNLASKCDYGQRLEEVLLERLISGVLRTEDRLKLLGREDLTYDLAKTILIQRESVRNESRVLAQSYTPQQVGKVHHSNNSYRGRNNRFQNNSNSTSNSSSTNNNKKTGPTPKWGPCHRCGDSHDVKTCPARNNTCERCSKLGHIAKVCKSSTPQSRSQHRDTRRTNFPASNSSQQNSNYHHSSNRNNNNRRFHRTHHVDDDINNAQVQETQQHQAISVDDEVDKLLKFSFNRVQVSYPTSDFVEVTPNQNSLPVIRDCVIPVQNNSINTVPINAYPTGSDSNPALCIDAKINNKSVTMEVDTGAGTSIMSNATFLKLFPETNLEKSSALLNSVSGTIGVAGETKVDVESSGEIFKLPLISCSNIRDITPLLGRAWLDVLAPTWRNVLRQLLSQPTQSISNIHDTAAPSLDELKALFPNVFATTSDSPITGFNARLVLKENATPVFHKAYPLAFALIEPVNKILDSWVASGKAVHIRISDWASPGVAVPKKGAEIRYCIDFKRTLNPQLRMDHYPLPTPDEIFSSLAGAAFFTSIDLQDAYTQLELHSDSQPLCVVNTHRGLFMLKRLIYGVSPAAPIFQNIMDVMLFGIPGVYCYIDNVLVWGKTKSECVQRTLLVLGRLNTHNARVKIPKCLWFVEEFEHLGFIVSKDGRKPAPSLTAAIVNCQTPINAREVRSFLGMCGFYSPFLPAFSTITKPLRELTCHSTKFVWSSECQSAFVTSKQMLSSSKLLIHFDPTLPIVVFADASPVGVGATLCHTVTVNNKKLERPISYASASLTPAQMNYAQIDREALASIFAVTKFHRFIWGRHFTLVTDNAAIQRILNPDRGLPVRTGHRLQHWAVTLQAYSYTLVHKKSEHLASADALSRLPMPTVIDEVMLVEVTPNLPLTSDVIAIETSKDPVLAKVFQYCHIGWPVKDTFKNDPAMQQYFKLRDSLTILDKCLLFSARVIIPLSLQAQVLTLLHEGHPGIVRTKLLARSVVWWPSLNSDIETLCNNCPQCSVVNFKPKKQYVPWPSATLPFERVHIDFFEYKSLKYFIYCDAFSKWIDIVRMQKCTAEDVESVLLPLFSIWGLPTKLVSDNGPPFDSLAFSAFCTAFNIQIIHSPPYSPESNGLAESGVQIAKKALNKIVSSYTITADSSSSSFQILNRAVVQFLFTYRNTPTTTTLKSPNDLLLSFKPKTLLTQLLPSIAKQPLTHQFRDDEIVFVRFNKKMPALKASIVRLLGPTRYLVSVEGVLKHAHTNQLSRTK